MIAKRRLFAAGVVRRDPSESTETVLERAYACEPARLRYLAGDVRSIMDSTIAISVFSPKLPEDVS